MTDFAQRRTVMVDTQVRPSDVTAFPIIDAMLTVRRERFVPPQSREVAYAGQMIELDDAVILDPRVFSKMIDGVGIGLSDVVLDLGCAYGYSTAVIAHLAAAVVGVDSDETRAADAQSTLSEQGIDNAAVIAGPLSEGAADDGPFDIIVIEGGVSHVPAALLDQLRDGGRITAIFMDGALGTVRVGLKSGGRISWVDTFNAAAPVLAGFETEAEFVL